MHDEAGFLSAIREAPADDTARLVFADWLDEQDDPACKTKAAFIRLELQLTEEPERSLNRTEALRTLEALAVHLDPAWLALISHPKLEACRVQFQFECPKRWDRLKPTDDPSVRFCSTCKKNVHYCNTLQEAQAHAANGNCVALTVVLARRSVLARPPQPALPRFVARTRRPPTPTPPVVLTPTPAPPMPPQSVRQTPGIIERLAVAGRLETPAPEPQSVPAIEPEQPPRRAGERPNWKRQRKKARHQNRTIQRDNWEDVD